MIDERCRFALARSRAVRAGRARAGRLLSRQRRRATPTAAEAFPLRQLRRRRQRSHPLHDGLEQRYTRLLAVARAGPSAAFRDRPLAAGLVRSCTRGAPPHGRGRLELAPRCWRIRSSSGRVAPACPSTSTRPPAAPCRTRRPSWASSGANTDAGAVLIEHRPSHRSGEVGARYRSLGDAFVDASRPPRSTRPPAKASSSTRAASPPIERFGGGAPSSPRARRRRLPRGARRRWRAEAAREPSAPRWLEWAAVHR